jgi:hypothetical protein
MSNYTAYIPNRQIAPVNHTNLLILIVYIALGIFLYFMWPTIKANNEQYNKYMCATGGNQADCETPLASEERLK